jgi:putative transposase
MANLQFIQMVEHGIFQHVTLHLKHRLHSPLEKSLIEQIMQYFPDRRTKSFDDYYPCIRNECHLFHVYNRIQFFVSMYNDMISNKNYFINELNERDKVILS